MDNTIIVEGIWIEEDLTWCKGYWDTYHFDFDIETKGPVFIWAIGDESTEELLDLLREDGIQGTLGTRRI